MKISICVPQFNRINYLLRSLDIIKNQTYPDIEVAISDDCSTDDTVLEIEKLIPGYKFPIIFSRNPQNLGYDRNYRKCIEIASGDYAFVIGNDDSLVDNSDIEYLVKFLQNNNFPDVGFCNMLEERTGGTLISRASSTSEIGAGPEVGLKYYSCFSFVGGLIYKRATFLNFNTPRYDGSIYAQMYLGVNMIANGARLFSIERPLVLKDMLLEGKFRNSYRDRIAKRWRDFKVVDGGLPSVMRVLIASLEDAGELNQSRLLYIFRRMYSVTFPHWLLDYRENGALPEAIGLIVGMSPWKNQDFKRLTLFNQLLILIIYMLSILLGLFVPVFLFRRFRQKLYSFFKRH